MSAIVLASNCIGDVPLRWSPTGDNGARPQTYGSHGFLLRRARTRPTSMAVRTSAMRKSLEVTGRVANGACTFIATETHQSP